MLTKQVAEKLAPSRGFFTFFLLSFPLQAAFFSSLLDTALWREYIR
jgi:hypothetical protein